MLESLLQDLERFLGVAIVQDGKEWKVHITKNMVVTVQTFSQGFRFHAVIGAMPKEEREEVLIYVMQANYLGQGTGGAAIGLDPSENFLTLSLPIVYDMNYRMFKDRLEEFVNYLSYWQEELPKTQVNK